jgi:hypothetical protein
MFSMINDGICNIPICAQNTRHAQYMAFGKVNGCSLIDISSINPTRNTASVVVYDISQSTDKSLLSTVYPTVSRGKVGCDRSRCVAGIVTGLILILSSLIAILLYTHLDTMQTY